MERAIDFTINDLAAKCRRKSELYHILATEGGIYLPPVQDSTQNYLRDVLRGKKYYINCKDVNMIHVPQYKGLRVREIIDFAHKMIHIYKYLPKYEYNKEPNRAWLCNVVNSLIPEKFKVFIADKVKERKQSLIQSKNLCVNVKQKFLNLFQNSQAVSLSKGKSNFLARLPKKSKNQSKLDEYEEEQRINDDKIIRL